jgi:hypothetical protein
LICKLFLCVCLADLECKVEKGIALAAFVGKKNESLSKERSSGSVKNTKAWFTLPELRS